MDFYGTIGPACADVKLLQQMVEAGMTGIRMNLSHGPLAAHKDWLVMLHKAGVKKLLIDLQGPELRIGRLPQPLSLTAGQTVRLGAQGIPCPAALVHSVQPGQELLLDDGKLLARVDTAEPDALVCTVMRGGVLQSRKSLAAPGADIQMPTLTTEDKENLAIAADCGVTRVMLPFVRGAADIRNLRQALAEAGAPGLKILAKIENLAGVQALPEFLPLVDEVVIARGDLGNAMPLWELPRCQKQLSAACRAAGVPFMVVTQMLDSMHTRAVPTRAEVSDIYNAVLDGASSLMLTGETAQNVLANLITLLLGLTVAGQMTADKFVRPDTLLIMALGLVAFIFDTAGGVLFAKLLNLFLPEGKKLNPMIGAAGISAFPMSGRVVNKMGLAEDNQNFLLMYSISVNVSGQIASVLAGGLILSLMA